MEHCGTLENLQSTTIGRIIWQNLLFRQISQNQRQQEIPFSVWGHSKHMEESVLVRWDRNVTFCPTCKTKHVVENIHHMYIYVH